MKPDIFIINSSISYTNKLKSFLEYNGYERVLTSDNLDSECNLDNCIVVAQGEDIRYSDIIKASEEGARFILTYGKGGFSQADVGLAKSARCVADGDFEYLLKLINEECNVYFADTSRTSATTDFVRDTLDGLGFNPAHKGYTYLIFAAKTSRGEMITKDVYPDIAKKYKTTVEEIMTVNGLENENDIIKGMKLLIP